MNYLHRTDVLVCGLIVHAYGTLLIVFAARNRYLIYRINYTAPVLDIQHKVADLRAFRVRVETRSLLLLHLGSRAVGESGALCRCPVVPGFVRWEIASG